MRYDETIYFQKVLPGEYDANTGDYGEEHSVEEEHGNMQVSWIPEPKR